MFILSSDLHLSRYCYDHLMIIFYLRFICRFSLHLMFICLIAHMCTYVNQFICWPFNISLLNSPFDAHLLICSSDVNLIIWLSFIWCLSHHLVLISSTICLLCKLSPGLAQLSTNLCLYDFIGALYSGLPGVFYGE